MEQHHISQAYEIAAEAIKNAILQGQYEAAQGVNRIQLATYFSVGKYVSTNTRQGVWGTGALEAISTRLRQLLPGLRGYSSESLKLMRKFYEGWKGLDAGKTADNDTKCNSVIAITELGNSAAVQLPIRELQFTNSADFPIDDFFNVPFTHHTQILSKVKSLDERLYYIHRCAEEHMSVETLKKSMANDDYHHQTDLPNNFTTTINKGGLARKAVMAFKDEYLLNFINVEEIGERDAADIDERVVEQQIVHNIKKFIMTFGHDFAFVGNQYRLEIYGVEHFPDLVFFNRELNALVVIELKTGDLASIISQLHDVKKANFTNHRVRQVTKFVYICRERLVLLQEMRLFLDKSGRVSDKSRHVSQKTPLVFPPRRPCPPCPIPLYS